MKPYKRGPHWSLAQRRAFAEALHRINTDNPTWSPRKKVQQAMTEAVPDDHSSRSAPDQVNSILRGKIMSELLAPYGIKTIEDLNPLKPKCPPARMRAKEPQPSC